MHCHMHPYGGVVPPFQLFSSLLLGPLGISPITQAMIIGVALGNYFSNLRKKHPEANRPLVDYSYVDLQCSLVLVVMLPLLELTR